MYCSDPERFKGEAIEPALVDLEADDEPNLKVEIIEQLPEQDAEIPEVSSTTNSWVFIWCWECEIFVGKLP